MTVAMVLPGTRGCANLGTGIRSRVAIIPRDKVTVPISGSFQVRTTFSRFYKFVGRILRTNCCYEQLTS